jgi:hypothetical protein
MGQWPSEITGNVLPNHGKNFPIVIVDPQRRSSSAAPSRRKILLMLSISSERGIPSILLSHRSDDAQTAHAPGKQVCAATVRALSALFVESLHSLPSK